MRFGFALPQVGSLAGPEALLMVAKRAEGLGVDCLWVLDRLLWPVIRGPLIRSATVLYRFNIRTCSIRWRHCCSPLRTPAASL